MNMVIQRTQALCNRCKCQHDAEIVRKNNIVVGVVYCPKGQYEYEISSNADMFLELRNRSYTDFSYEATNNLRFVLNCILITNACNFSCTVCGTKAKTEKEDVNFLPVEEIIKRALQVKNNGGWMLQLSGGEPTLHPDLLVIINRLSGMGLRTGIATNGYTLGRDNSLAERLKSCGLERVHLQFDSFDHATLKELGRDFLGEKQAAIRNVIKANLNLALTCTVTKYNLNELGNLLSHGLELGHSVKNIGFATAAPIGRYLIDDINSPDREQIVEQLLKVGNRYNFSFDDFLPLPAYLPWRIQLHPDCGIHIVFARTPQGIFPLNYYVDLKKIYKYMKETQAQPNIVSKYIMPITYVLRSIKKGKAFKFLALAAGIIMLKRRYSLVNVGIANYKAGMFLDKKRISRCASVFYTSKGPVKACLHFFFDNQLCEVSEKPGPR